MHFILCCVILYLILLCKLGEHFRNNSNCIKNVVHGMYICMKQNLLMFILLFHLVVCTVFPLKLPSTLSYTWQGAVFSKVYPFNRKCTQTQPSMLTFLPQSLTVKWPYTRLSYVDFFKYNEAFVFLYISNIAFHI